MNAIALPPEASKAVAAPPRVSPVRAERVAFLVDGDAYFHALSEALSLAERTVYVSGWDIDARAKLPDPNRSRLVPFTTFLDRIAKKRPGLQIYLLGWDFAALFTLERLPFPALALGWATHERVHFVADGVHPPGASHHQKIVVVDDRVAFSGGFDVAVKRWDTSAHDPEDPRRKGPLGEAYGPFHDVQIAVSGAAARSLGDLFRARWARASGEELTPPEPTHNDPWPPNVQPDATNARVSIACTQPSWQGTPSIRAVEATMADSIRRARRWIYIENQYISADSVAAMLAERLDEPDGPEVVVVAPKCCSGWLEERTMGALRGYFLARLRKARYAKQRLRAVSPSVGDVNVFVHAKIMVIDDSSARVGSANLSNRSMALDTECDVVLLGDDPRSEAAVASLRNRLLGEHLGRSEEEIAGALRTHGSIVRIVDEMGSEERGFHELTDPPPSADERTWLHTIADPERPLEAERLLVVLSRYVQRRQSVRRVLVGIAAATMVCLVVVLTLVGR